MAGVLKPGDAHRSAVLSPRRELLYDVRFFVAWTMAVGGLLASILGWFVTPANVVAVVGVLLGIWTARDRKGDRILEELAPMRQGIDRLVIEVGGLGRKHDSLLAKQDDMLRAQGRVLEKQDQMLVKQDRSLDNEVEMLHKQGLMLVKQDATVDRLDRIVRILDERL